MNMARIVQDGTPRGLYERPISHFVADFIGDANIVPVTVESRQGELASVRLGPLMLTLPHRARRQARQNCPSGRSRCCWRRVPGPMRSPVGFPGQPISALTWSMGDCRRSGQGVARDRTRCHRAVCSGCGGNDQAGAVGDCGCDPGIAAKWWPDLIETCPNWHACTQASFPPPFGGNDLNRYIRRSLEYSTKRVTLRGDSAC